MLRTICTICRDELLPQPAAAFLCGHVFHQTCIAGLRNGICPVCRREISQPVNLFIEAENDAETNVVLEILTRLITEANRVIGAMTSDASGLTWRIPPHVFQNGNGVEMEQEITIPIPWNHLPTGRRRIYINVNRRDNTVHMRVVQRNRRRRNQQVQRI